VLKLEQGSSGRHRHSSGGGGWWSSKQGHTVGGPVRGHQHVGRLRKEKGKWARPSKTVPAVIYTDATYLKRFQIQFKLVQT
jgi:hypothetical protein